MSLVMQVALGLGGGLLLTGVWYGMLWFICWYTEREQIGQKGYE